MTMNFDYQKAATMNNILTRLESLELSRAAQANEIETLRKLILFQDTAIESLDAQYKRMALSQDDDRAARIRDRAEINNLFANFREAVAAQTEAMRKLVDAAPEFIRYVHAGDLQKIIDERVHVAIAGTQLVVTVKMEPR